MKFWSTINNKQCCTQNEFYGSFGDFNSYFSDERRVQASIKVKILSRSVVYLNDLLTGYEAMFSVQRRPNKMNNA